MAKTSHDTVSKVKFIEKEADQKTKDKLSKGEETINKVYTILKRREQVGSFMKYFKKSQR